MRDLNMTDVFRMSRILKTLDIKIDAKDKTAEQLGGEILLQIGEKLYMAENSIKEFMSSLVGCTPAEFEQLPLDKVFDYVEEFKKLPGVVNFFKSASRLMK